MPASLPSLGWAMVFVNFALYRIPMVRQTFDREALGHAGTDYRSAQEALVIVATIATGVCALITILGAALLTNLK